MAQKPIYLTTEGLAKLKEEYEYLRKVRRPEVVQKIQQARELANTTDSAEYEDAKNEQALVEGRILTLEGIINNAVIIPSESAPSGFVKVGSRVRVRTAEDNEVEYTIVGSAEANPKEHKISNESPVGQSLLGRRVGEEVQVMAPAGVVRLTIVEIS